MTSSIEDSAGRTISLLKHTVQEFAAARDWGQFHNPKNLTMSLASEVGELAAIFRWVRDDASDAFVASGEHRDELEAEIGDVGICLLLLCARVNIDLGDAIVAKVGTNAIKYPVESSRGRADPPRVG
jgi:dCTP diphosphatase